MSPAALGPDEEPHRVRPGKLPHHFPKYFTIVISFKRGIYQFVCRIFAYGCFACEGWHNRWFAYCVSSPMGGLPNGRLAY